MCRPSLEQASFCWPLRIRKFNFSRTFSSCMDPVPAKSMAALCPNTPAFIALALSLHRLVATGTGSTVCHSGDSHLRPEERVLRHANNVPSCKRLLVLLGTVLLDRPRSHSVRCRLIWPRFAHRTSTSSANARFKHSQEWSTGAHTTGVPCAPVCKSENARRILNKIVLGEQRKKLVLSVLSHALGIEVKGRVSARMGAPAR